MSRNLHPYFAQAEGPSRLRRSAWAHWPLIDLTSWRIAEWAQVWLLSDPNSASVAARSRVAVSPDEWMVLVCGAERSQHAREETA